MAGDYTRMTFRPRRDYAGVLMQQGRVTVDADWNELVELLDRRFRAELVDTIGRCVYSKETPDAFLIAVSGSTLTIGPGRAYVHGLLAENHGSDPQEYDPVLGELRGTGPVPYEKQPYLPDVANVAPLPAGGTYVAYLDVWEREVTYLEDPDLVEKAIAVDTATRLQTVWQVKLLKAPGDTTCDSRVPGWDSLTAPSAGRLTTTAVGVPTPTDPCTIAPAGGYRGTENRLYRIEIHDAGPLGTATFKWSQDNAAIAAHVDTIDAARSELTLVRLGRDGVQRIRVGDWVEATDDWLELNGLPGELRKVTAVDEVTQSITLAAPLSAGRFDATDATRHTRVVRWDQKGAAVDAAGGLVAVPATAGSPIVLEDGVQIAFDTDPAGGDFHVGDYWVFAARTADASVERLDAEPPRGIKHHFCRLAVVSFPDTVTDCRIPPAAPEDHGCDCTVCVTPESHASGTLTIQQAIDLVKAIGGKICLQAGVYRLKEPLRIVGARSLELQGKGWRTLLVGPGRQPAIIVETSLGVSIDSLAVVTSPLAARGAVPTGIAIGLRNTVGTAIERCVLLQVGMLGREAGLGLTDLPAAGTAPLATMLGTLGAGAPLIALDGLVLELLVRENVLAGTVGIGPLWADLQGTVDERRALDPALARTRVSAAADVERSGRGYLLSSDLAVEENLFLCALAGVALEGFSLQLGETRITRNSFLGCVRAGITSLGLTGPDGRIDVTGNLLRIVGTGIAVGTDDTRVSENDVFGLRPTKDPARLATIFEGFSAAALSSAAGIVLAASIRPAGIDRCEVVGNRVREVGGDGIGIRTLVASAAVAQNIVERVGGGGIVMDERAVAELVTVECNQLLDVALLADRTAPAAGILVTRTQNAFVLGNTVRGVGRVDVGGQERLGIGLAGCGTTRVTGNDVSEVGPAEFIGFAAGIGLLAGFQQAAIADNVVRRSGAPPAAPLSTWYALLVEDPSRKLSSLSHAALLLPESLLLLGRFASRAVSLPRGRGSLGVHGNVLDAYGDAAAARVETDGSCLFNDNRCFLTTARQGPVAHIGAGALVASSNYLEGVKGATALEVVLPAGAGFTAVGNIASGPIALNGTTPLPAPWDQLNVS